MPAGTVPVSGVSTRAPRYVPTRHCGTYRLPPSLIDLLGSRLRAFKNAQSANQLAVFLARMNAGPRRFGRSFPIDRRALADHPDLHLSEDRIRGAITTLEKVGFIERVPVNGSSYRQHADGVRRKAIQWRFGNEFNRRFSFLVSKRQVVTSPKGRGVVSKERVDNRAVAMPLGEIKEKNAAASMGKVSPRLGKGRVNDGALAVRGGRDFTYAPQTTYRASHRPHVVDTLPDGSPLPLWSDTGLEAALARFASSRRQ